jgi:hypothetical protein
VKVPPVSMPIRSWARLPAMSQRLAGSRSAAAASLRSRLAKYGPHAAANATTN